MTDRVDSPDNLDDDALEDNLAGLLGFYIDRINAGEFVDQGIISSEHPEEASAIIAELANLQLLRDVDSVPDSLGTLGDYTLHRQIGRGGMGVVYEAWQGSMNRQVALKVLPAGIAADQRACARFLREAQTAGQLNHENVVRVYSTGVEEGTPWYSMELIEGETLASILAKIQDAEPETETPFGKKECVEYFAKMADAFADVADGLQHAHSKGVTHRDIKPSNLILDRGGRATGSGHGCLRIVDFGLARLDGQDSVTLSGDFIGTPLYMSPEQARRKKIAVDHRTDVYSLGATMYETVTGRPPFRGKDHADTLSQIIERDPVAPRKVNPRVPKDLETIVLKCLRKEPRDRYGTAEALGQDLRRFVRGAAVEARPEEWSERLFRWLRRYRRRLAFAGTLVFLALAVVGLTVDRYWAERERQGLLYEPAVRHVLKKLRGGEFIFHILERQTVDSGAYVGSAFQPLTQDDFRDLWESRGMEEVEASVRALQVVVDALPEKRDGHYHLARAYFALERREAAARELRRTIALDPDFPPARVLEWDLEIESLSVQERRERLAQLLEESRDGSAWEADWLAANWHFAHWRFTAAAKSWGRIIDRRGKIREEDIYLGAFADAYLGRGLAHLESQRFAYAQNDFAAAAALGSELQASLLLAKALYRGDRRKDAAEILNDLYKSVSPSGTDEITLWIVAVYNALGDFQRALEWSRKLETAPCRHRLESFFLLRVGDEHAATLAGYRAIEGYARDPIAHFVLAKALLVELLSLGVLEEKRVDEFLRIARRAVELEGGSSRYRSLLRTAEAMKRGEFVKKSSLQATLHGNAADSISVVVPNVYANEEPKSWPCCSGFDDTPMRWQLLLPADQFAALSRPTLLTAIAFRVDETVQGTVRSGFNEVEIRMSTSPVAELRPRFSDNVGEDAKTVFYGVWEIQSEDDGVRPRAFDEILQLDPENYFRYDPAAGGLLIDMFIHSGWRSSPEFDNGCWLYSTVGGSIEADISRCNHETRGQPGCNCMGTPVVEVTFQPLDK